MLPEEGGYYVWVATPLGHSGRSRTVGGQWMYSLVDMAIYPVLFTQYLAYLRPSPDAPVQVKKSLCDHLGTAAVVNLRRGAGRAECPLLLARSSSGSLRC